MISPDERGVIMAPGIAVLLTGYVLILLSFAWTMLLATAALPSVARRRVFRDTTNLRLLRRSLVGWTVLCLGLLILGAWLHA
jgi:hypothetical protein